MLGNKQNEPSNFRTKNCVEINDVSRGTHNKSNQIKFKNLMIRSNLCDYNDAYILVSGPLTMMETEVMMLQKEQMKEVIFKTCGPFIECRSNADNIQIDNTKDIDVVWQCLI